jgi:hypothetical protein
LADEEVGYRAGGAKGGRCAEGAVGGAGLAHAGLAVAVVAVKAGAEAEGDAAAEVESLAAGRAVRGRNAPRALRGTRRTDGCTILEVAVSRKAPLG